MLQLESRYAATFGDRSALEIAQHHPFAMVMSFGDTEPACSHIPVLADGRDKIEKLRGHLARANLHTRSLTDGSKMLVIFNGPQRYISPTWYENPRERAPTWNYAVVHVWGTIRLTGENELNQMLDDLAAWGEAGSPDPWLPAQYNPARRAALLPAIVGFELRVERVDAKFKLNQHNTDTDRRRVISSLMNLGDADSVGVAQLMQETLDRDKKNRPKTGQ